MSLKDVEFFGAVDRAGGTTGGKIGSDYPSWYFTEKIDVLRDDIARKERQLKSGAIPPENVPYMQEELRRSVERLKEIDSSMPKIEGKDKDELAKLRDEIGSKITDAMFSQYDMDKGFASPHEEARRMTERKIDVAGNVTILRKLGLNVTGDSPRINRIEAEKAYKIISKALGENANTERLRKSGYHPSYRSEPTLQQLIRE